MFGSSSTLLTLTVARRYKCEWKGRGGGGGVVRETAFVPLRGKATAWPKAPQITSEFQGRVERARAATPWREGGAASLGDLTQLRGQQKLSERSESTSGVEFIIDRGKKQLNSGERETERQRKRTTAGGFFSQKRQAPKPRRERRTLNEYEKSITLFTATERRPFTLPTLTPTANPTEDTSEMSTPRQRIEERWKKKKA